MHSLYRFLKRTSGSFFRIISKLLRGRRAEPSLDARSHAAQPDESHFRSLFENAPISFWVEDFSAVRAYIDGLRRRGVIDLPSYIDAHPEEIGECAKRVRVIDVNRATLELYQAESKEQLLPNVRNVFSDEALLLFKEQLLALARGHSYFENETVNYTGAGQKRRLLLRSTIPPEAAETWARVYVVVTDSPKNRSTAAQLEQSEGLFRALFNLSPDAVLVIDPHSPDVAWPIIDCNIAACLMNGYTREELVGQSIDLLNVTPGTEAERSIYLRQLRDIGSLKLETHHRHKNGSTFPVEVSSTIITLGERELIIGIDRDITQRKQAENAQRQNEERFQLLAWATKDAVWDWNLETDQVWWGEGLQKIFHYSSEITHTNAEWWFEHVHPDDLAKVNRTISQALENGMEFWSKEYRFQRKDGTYAEIMDRGYIMRKEDGAPYRMVGAMIDITDRKQMESSLLQANEQMRQYVSELQRRNSEIDLLNEMSRLLQACQSTEEAYRIIGELANQLFPRTTGAIYLFNTSRSLVRAATWWGQLPPEEQVLDPKDCLGLSSGRVHFAKNGEVALVCRHVSDPLPAAAYCLPMQIQGEILGFLHVRAQNEEYLDEAKSQLAYTVLEQTGMTISNLDLRAALREQSIRDPLTGLYNRRYMEEVLRQQLSRVTRSLHPLAIIMIDIDHFKSFNDLYGHAAGDLLLRELGRFLQNHIRREDTACRYGGEEFILIMPDVTLEHAQERAASLRQEAKKLQVHDLDKSFTGITLSIGVAVYPQHGRNMETVLRTADSALYRAKQEGRDRIVVAEHLA